MTLLSMLCSLSDILVLGILVGHCKDREKGLRRKSCDDYQPAPVYCCFQQFPAILEGENAVIGAVVFSNYLEEVQRGS